MIAGNVILIIKLAEGTVAFRLFNREIFAFASICRIRTIVMTAVTSTRTMAVQPEYRSAMPCRTHVHQQNEVDKEKQICGVFACHNCSSQILYQYCDCPSDVQHKFCEIAKYSHFVIEELLTTSRTAKCRNIACFCELN